MPGALGFVRFDYSGHGASSGRFADGTIGVGRRKRSGAGPTDRRSADSGGIVDGRVADAADGAGAAGRIAGLLGLACAADFTEYLLWERLDPPLRERLRRER